MARTYSRQEIINFCEEASKDMGTFYQQKFVNYKGKTKEKEYYTEIIAKWLLDNLDKFNVIRRVERTSSYNQKHTGKMGEKTNRVEEYVAKLMFNTKQLHDKIGKIIDYQTPLKNSNKDEGVGKIDLLSRDDKTKSVYILELKKDSSEETMLRCVLECYTYLRIVTKEKLFNEFNIPANYELKASPLVYKNGFQYKEFMDEDRKYLHLLMKELNSIPFFVKEKIVYDISSK